MINITNEKITVRTTRREDFEGIQELCQRVYTFSAPWRIDQLQSHLNIFPEGQLVGVDKISNKIVGMAASLVVDWDRYVMNMSWKDFTSAGYFANHNTKTGRTLYGAEVMVDPNYRSQGIGKLLYEGRREIVQKLKLLRIRAGARIRGYGTYAEQMSPLAYLFKVSRFELYDPTISFQLKHGFKILSLVPNYLHDDPESLGYAAVIEWLNDKVATAKQLQQQESHYEKTFRSFLTSSR